VSHLLIKTKTVVFGLETSSKTDRDSDKSLCSRVYIRQMFCKVKKVKCIDIAVCSLTCDTATGTHMPYRITQCHLPPGRGDIPAFTLAEAGT